MDSKKRNAKVGWLTLNRACNNRCEWCYAQGTGFKDVNLPLDLAENLIYFMKDIGVGRVILLGGEPTLYAHLLEIIRMLIRTDIQPILVSNGRKFADKNYARMIADTGLNAVGFSMKAANKEQYMRLTGSDGYDETIKGIHNLNELGVSVPVSVTVVQALIETLPELLENLIKEGVKRLSIDMGNPVISKEVIKAAGIADPRELSTVVDKAYEVLKDSNVDYDIFASIPLCIISKETKEELIQAGRIVSCCHAMLENGIIFDQDGNVIPCNGLSDFPIGRYGVDFADTKSFEKFSSSEEMGKFQQTFLRYPTERCVDCDDWNLCGGGCPLRWLYWNPQDYITQPERR